MYHRGMRSAARETHSPSPLKILCCSASVEICYCCTINKVTCKRVSPCKYPFYNEGLTFSLFSVVSIAASSHFNIMQARNNLMKVSTGVCKSIIKEKYGKRHQALPARFQRAMDAKIYFPEAIWK